jgi:hypothetical protein
MLLPQPPFFRRLQRLQVIWWGSECKLSRKRSAEADISTLPGWERVCEDLLDGSALAGPRCDWRDSDRVLSGPCSPTTEPQLKEVAVTVDATRAALKPKFAESYELRLQNGVVRITAPTQNGARHALVTETYATTACGIHDGL